MEPVNDTRLYSQRYQITHLIARGGMAMVYRAEDTLLHRPVALKVLYPELSSDPTFVERFRREAQAAANLSHPNIVPVFDWGEDAGTYFIVMELVEGTSLADVLRRTKTLTPSRAVPIAAQVAGALGYAHRSGMVHRDVKPGNILLTDDGVVKVTDFGIAQAIATDDHLAAEGSVMGTATYFSPEQAEGAPVDGRSDVYSLGIVLYEMLAGRPPFVGETPVEVSHQHVHATVVPPTTYNPSIPADLSAIVMQALAKSPGARYQNADELRADLLRFTEGRPVNAAKSSPNFYSDDATRAVATVSAGERTQAVPIMQGPRTDIRRRRSSSMSTRNWIVALVVLVVAGAAYFAFGSSSVSSMPDVVGQSVSAATSTLRADGLVIGTTTLVASKQPSGTVVSTDPPAGSKISSGQSVTLQISEGKTSQSVSVPSVTGMTLSDAESQLQTALLGYTVQFTSTAPTTGAAPDTVLSQTPLGGVMAQTGDKVILTVLAPGSSFPMPDVSNDTEAQAANTLGQAGLNVSQTTSTQCSNKVQSGLVVATVPAAQQPVKAGASIQLVLSSGVCQVVVPTVVGQTQAQANTALAAQGISGTYVTAAAGSCSPSQAGTIVDQSAAPGTTVPYGSSITLSICSGSASG